MAVAQGFSKITTSGSVFMYDTADGVNSFKGKPATNILQGITPGQSTSPPLFVVSYGTESVYIPGLGKTVTSNYCNIYNDYNGGSGACCPSLFNFGAGFTGGVTGSTTYTYQIIYRTTDGYYSDNYMYRYEYGPSGYITEGGLLSPSRMEDLGDGWIHGWGTFTTNAATTMLYGYLFHYQYATQNKVQVAGIMITQGTQVLRPNQFLAPQASRSNTQSLLPLISNSSLSVSDVSFNSSGSMFFDGTNDTIGTPSNSNNNIAGDITMELILNRTDGYTGVVMHKEVQYTLIIASNGDISYADSSLWSYAAFGYHYSGITPGVFHHVVATKNGSTVTIYVNGNVVVSQSFGSAITQTNNNLYIGSYNGNQNYFAGQIPVSRIYNRALTPGEVLNNYNHYKTKYNLP
jgi:hypothetical protein